VCHCYVRGFQSPAKGMRAIKTLLIKSPESDVCCIGFGHVRPMRAYSWEQRVLNRGRKNGYDDDDIVICMPNETDLFN
jgi:hypothetical protein